MSAATTLSLLTVGLCQPRLSFPFSLNLHRPFPSFSRSHTSHGLEPLRASASEPISQTTSTVTVENDSVSDSTAFVIRAKNRIGLLQLITRVFKVLGLRIEKAIVEFEGDFLVKRFFVTDSHGNKIEDGENLDRIEKALMEAIGGGGGGEASMAMASTRGIVVRRAGLVGDDAGDRKAKAKAERMFALMDGFLKNDPISLQRDILDHVEYTVARSRFSFDDFEAYQVMWA
ncbi:hypothetical protein CsSME_00031969 [Camellia sinensis var. sinensis]